MLVTKYFLFSIFTLITTLSVTIYLHWEEIKKNIGLISLPSKSLLIKDFLVILCICLFAIGCAGLFVVESIDDINKKYKVFYAAIFLLFSVMLITGNILSLK
jgi:hypothetical protein